MTTANLPDGYPNPGDVSLCQAELDAAVVQLLQRHPHAQVLNTLLTAFAALASVHPCCTLPAALNAAAVGKHLARAATQRPNGTPIH